MHTWKVEPRQPFKLSICLTRSRIKIYVDLKCSVMHTVCAVLKTKYQKTFLSSFLCLKKCKVKHELLTKVGQCFSRPKLEDGGGPMKINVRIVSRWRSAEWSQEKISLLACQVANITTYLQMKVYANDRTAAELEAKGVNNILSFVQQSYIVQLLNFLSVVQFLHLREGNLRIM